MNRFEKILLTVFFVEIFIGGGGRLIDFGLVSIRQVLFLLLLGTFIFRIIKEKAIFNKEINTFFRFNPVSIGIYVLIAWFCVSSLVGFINGNPLGAIVTDFLRVSYIVLFFPLAYYIAKDRFPLQRIITLLKYSAIVVSIFTITVSILGKTIFAADFYHFWKFMNTIMNDDLFFRPSNSVFYKSHFFVLIGIILAFNDLLHKKYSKLNTVLIIVGSISVLWSETRGFLLAFMVSIIMIILFDIKIIVDPIKGFANKCKQLLKTKDFIKRLVISLLVIMVVPFLFENMTLERFGTDVTQSHKYSDDEKKDKKYKEEVDDVSVNKRMEFIEDSIHILSKPANLIIGTGYGSEIAGRITGIEMSFLDILVEQGIIGLAIWGCLFLIVYYNYHVSYKRGQRVSSLDVALLAAFMGVLLLTNINPFINNPIGISFFLVLLIISQQRKEISIKEGLK
nr:O-antigen ligase family protein [uncultured Bacillus sp.]